MSAFDSTVKKISAILGITTAGQKAKAGSVPVTLASDEDLLSRLPSSLGQKTAANSLGVVLASDAALVTGATPDAAAAGAIFPAAGLYNPTPTALTAGQLGRQRLNARRAAFAVPDQTTNMLSTTGVADYNDMEGSTTTILGTYSALAGTFFDGSEGGFGGTARYVRVPMSGWEALTVGWLSTLGGGTLTVALYLWPYANGTNAEELILLDTVLADSGMYGPDALGAGAGATTYRAVPALRTPTAYIVIKLLPGADPSSGAIKLWIARR